MAEIINLRQARKAKARAEKEAKAAANRTRFGRSARERDLERAEQTRAERRLDGHRLEDDPAE
jgi:hypothetical protein